MATGRGGARAGAGRPAFEPTDEQRKLVKTHAGMGTTQADICLILQEVAGQPITEKTLRKAFGQELAVGSATANATVASKLFAEAKNGNTAAMIFWLKTRAGWRETTRLEHTGADGEPIQQRVGVIDERKIKAIREKLLDKY